MLRSETVRQKWRDKIWTHASIQALTSKILEQDTTENSHKEISKLRHDTKINFFAFRVRRSMEVLTGQKYRLRFFIDISYTRWADPNGANYNAVLDGIEVLQELVLTELGSTWNGLVATSEPQKDPPEISVVSIGEEYAFKADYNYSGFICNA